MMSERRQSSAEHSGADSMPRQSRVSRKPKTKNTEQRKLVRERKLQIYLPSPEARRKFRAAAAEAGMTSSEFLFHLFQLFRRGELGHPSADDARGAIEEVKAA